MIGGKLFDMTQAEIVWLLADYLPNYPDTRGETIARLQQLHCH